MQSRQLTGMSIVLIGQFNPLMYHPTWFRLNGVISGEEESLIINSKEPNLVVSQGLTFFRNSSMDFNITPDRFSVTINREPFILLKDTIVKTFERLGSTTIIQLGINYYTHVIFTEKSLYQKFADLISPKERWTRLLGDEIEGDNRMSGLLSLTMMKKTQDGRINITLEPSKRIELSVFVHCNFHYDLDDNSRFADYAMDIVNKKFDDIQNNADDYINELVEGI